jgi:DNA recombination-dependent growth factor C
VTFSRFRVESAKDAPFDPKKSLLKGLRSRAFEPIDPRSEDDRATGFVELHDADATGFSPTSVHAGEHALFGFRVDTLRVPGVVLKAEMTKWQQAFEKENARKATRAETARQRTELKDMLRKRAVPSTKVHDVSWNVKTAQLQVWASSRKSVDEAVLAIEEAFGVKLELLVPAAVAQRLGVADGALAPTAELVGVEVPAGDLVRGGQEAES